MAYKDPEKQREYQREWYKRKRAGLIPDQPDYHSKEVSICPNCGKETNSKYCDNSCQHEYELKQRIETLDKSDIGKTFKTPASQKRYIIYTRGEQCEICGITEWMGQTVPLVMDHIDGISDNNAEDNLRLVCGNCDMQLPTYKSKNIGNGRHYRRERYDKGQSY